MKRSDRLILCLSLVSALLLSSLQGQDLDSLLHNKRVYEATSIGERPNPRIDGLLDDAVWQLGEWQGNFTQQQPVGGVPGTERTYVKVVYNRSSLFVAIVCQDSEPDLIRDIFDRRDALNGDMTGIALDSYFDKRTAFEFNLSAAGQKMDLKHSGDYKWDMNWNGVWDGATSQNDTGWIAEMKIPFSQLRYDDREQHVWGMHVWRWISRKYEEDQWQYIPREAPAMVYLFGEIHGITDIRGSRQVEFLPYASLAMEKNQGVSSIEPLRPNAGLDTKVGISSDYTLDLSINPDYGQVEADPSVLNLTAFETFFDEKRPFFMEGNEIFDFELDGDIPYYSRRIGSAPSLPQTSLSGDISEVPRNSTILGAAKLTGKSPKGLSMGVVNGLTANEYAVETDQEGVERDVMVAPMSNYLATRMKREFKEGTTIAGGMFNMVHRISDDSILNTLSPFSAYSGGLDLLHYWKNREYYVEVKALASHLSGSASSIHRKQESHIHRFQRPDADYLEVDSLKESLTGHGGLVQVGKKGGDLNFNLTGQYRSPGLNLNDVGYIRQADFFGIWPQVSYRMNDPGTWVRNYTLTFNQEARWSFGGENIYHKAGLDFDIMSNKHWRYYVSYAYDFSHLDTRELRGGPSLRVDGEHRSGIFIMSDYSRDLNGSFGGHFNSYSVKGSHSEVIHARITWLPVRKMKLSANANLRFEEFHQQYVTTLEGSSSTQYLAGSIDRQTGSLTFRAEFFFTPELSLQYYGNPYYSVGKFEEFKRVTRGNARDREARFEILDAEFEPESNRYHFRLDGEEWSFGNPDFSFMQFRSNLVLRWEYKLGSTLFLVWAHDRSDWRDRYQPLDGIAGDLFGIPGNHVLMCKLNYWFSI
jgi:hypothetical protein